jgi:hypothetical protein
MTSDDCRLAARHSDADRIDSLTERVQVVEEKLEHVSTPVGQLSATMDRGFKVVDEAFLEQRQYTEFCCARLSSKAGRYFARPLNPWASMGIL